MRILFALLFLIISLPALAITPVCDNNSLINQVTFTLNAKEWVVSQTALVNVSVIANVDAAGLASLQGNILKKLAQISKEGDWHITSFDRSQDQSGLEKVQIAAEARVPLTGLTGLREMAKSISKPGEFYTIDNISFTPSDQELAAANANLRSKLYEQAKEELARVNQLYTDQKYYIHKVDFSGYPRPMPLQSHIMAMRSEEAAMPSTSNMAPVANRVELSATVVLAAMQRQSLTALH